MLLHGVAKVGCGSHQIDLTKLYIPIFNCLDQMPSYPQFPNSTQISYDVVLQQIHMTGFNVFMNQWYATCPTFLFAIVPIEIKDNHDIENSCILSYLYLIFITYHPSITYNASLLRIAGKQLILGKIWATRWAGRQSILGLMYSHLWAI